MKRVLIAVICTFLWIAPAHAQTCRGAITFEDAPLRWGANVAFSSNTHGVEAGVAKAFDKFFAGGGVVFQGVSDISAAKGFFGGAGREFPVGAAKKYFACPTVSVFKTWGASPFVDGSASQLIFNFGGTVGFESGTSGNTKLVPTFGFSINILRTSAESPTFLAVNGVRMRGAGGAGAIDLSNTETFGAIQLGIGLLFNERMSLTPSLIIPFGSDSAEVLFSAVLTMKFGK
jgi:hypothetical protein